MYDTATQIPALVCLLSHATGRAETTISRLASGSGATVHRLRTGRDITVARAQRIVQWLSDHWPSDLEWPDGIVRPAPSRPPAPAGVPTSPNEAKAPAGGGPLAVVRREIAAMRGCMHSTPADHAGAQYHEERALRAAEALGPDGRVCRRAVCEALRVPEHVYDATVRRYRDGGLVAPRRGGDPARVLALLERAGDARFRRSAA